MVTAVPNCCICCLITETISSLRVAIHLTSNPDSVGAIDVN
jgi:hypothetical protein